MPSALIAKGIASGSSNLEINSYDIAALIPDVVLEDLRRNSARTNVVLPLIEKALLKERSGDRVNNEDLWITCSSIDSKGNRTLDLLLACSSNEMGRYPIFIVATVPFTQLNNQFLFARVQNLIQAMARAVPIHRVYSVFAPEPVARLFAEIWTNITGVAHYQTPYYAAMLSFCTRFSIRNRRATSLNRGVRYNLRPASISDLQAVAELCYGFAEESEPFVLDKSGAWKEAQILIHNEEVWVHETQSEDSTRREIACLVAYTRNTETTATITKVMTSPGHRGLGCAQRLVRQVCKHLLYSGKQSVALYVAHNNHMATKVYHNVGFVGLGEESSGQPIEGVERWSEIGFDRTKVQLGHW